MVRFPETAESEWRIVAEAEFAHEKFAERLAHEARVEKELENQRVRHVAKQMLLAEIDAETTPGLEMMTLADYRSTPAMAPADLIDGVLKDNGLCVMLGPSGSGKSTLALQMLHSTLTGDDWLGQQSEKLIGSAGIVTYDMDAPMVGDWMSGFPSVDPNRVSIVNAYKRGNPLGVPALRQQIADAWRSLKVEIVLVDSFSASFFGHDQNDAAATMAHYRDLLKFALTEVGARALIVIAHSTESSPGKARGSTVHHDVADSIVSVVAEKGARKVSMIKYRAARGQQQMDPVAIGAPDPQTHLVDLDIGAMTMEGMHLPPSAAAMAFPETTAEPEPQKTYELDGLDDLAELLVDPEDEEASDED